MACHGFIGAAAALLVMSAVAWRTRQPVAWPLIWILLGHLLAMFPDVLFSFFDVLHYPWMDVFVWHIGAHFVSGHLWTWYGVFVSCLALYLWTIYRRAV